MAIKSRHLAEDNVLGDATGASPAANWRAEKLSPECYSRFSHRLLVAYCFIAALSIAAAQTILLSLVAYTVCAVVWGKVAPSRSRAAETLFIAAPMMNWFLICLLTALVGIDPLRSVFETVKGSFLLLIPFAVFLSLTCLDLSPREFYSRIESYIAALVFGQCLAAIETLLSELLPDYFPQLVPGPLTESGQLVLIIPLLLFSIFSAFSASSLRDRLAMTAFGKSIPPQLYAGIWFLLFLIVAWPGAILWDESSLGTLLSRLVALVLALSLAVPTLRRGAPAIKEKFGAVTRTLHLQLFQLIWPAAALLFAALIINLKRGPWLGVFVELMVLGYILSKRMLFWSVVLSFLVLLSLSPARTRMANANEHFAISGGRKEMWELGEEIAQRYSMGLGINNARYMRQLDPAIPEEHRHMHNNFLNVLVETGWIGLTVYAWWMLAVLAFGFRLWRFCCSSASLKGASLKGASLKGASSKSKDRVSRQSGVLALCLSVALLGWQVSGSVEYNFGDGEIRLIAFFYMGLLLALGSFNNYADNFARSPQDL